MYFHKPQEPPPLWGSPQDRQYSIWRNMEDIYRCDHESEVLIIPGFWGLPCHDYSGYNNYGTNHGATYKDGSLDFDATNDILDIGSDPSIDISLFDELTLSSWAYLTDNSVDRIIIGEGIGYSSAAYQLRYDAGDDYWELQAHDGGYQYAKYSQSSPTLNKWTHVVGTYNGTNIEIWVDGVKGAITDTLGTPTDKSLLNKTIGGATDAYRLWKGFIDEVRISKATRTADQIALFHDNKYGLYQPVGRPIWSIPAAGVTIPIFMQNMRGSFNSPGTRGGFIN